MEAEDGRQTSNEGSNEVSGSINHGRMSITEEEDEVNINIFLQFSKILKDSADIF